MKNWQNNVWQNNEGNRFQPVSISTCPHDSAINHSAKPMTITQQRKFVLAAMLLVWLSWSVFGATYHVRQGASGTDSGADWNNAYPTLPATLERGSTYYIAAGSYVSYTFDDARSGTLVTTIKKATIAEHGSNTGWDNSYASGQVVFADNITFTTPNWILDGVTRDESDWFDGDAYGFKIAGTGENQNINYEDNCQSNIVVQYMFIDAPFDDLPPGGGQAAIYGSSDGNAPVRYDMVWRRMYVHGSCNVWFLRPFTRALVEYCASSGARGDLGNNHGEIWNLYYEAHGAIIRYNKVRDAYLGEDGGTAIWALTESEDCKIYGNEVYGFAVGDGVVGWANPANSAQNLKFYNNTILNCVEGNAGVAMWNNNGHQVYNNIFADFTACNFNGATVNYNAFDDGNSRGSNAQTDFDTASFINYAALDFRLRTNTVAGTTLSSPYTYDLLGNLRGGDGVDWSRGAYQLTNGIAPLAAGTWTVRTVISQ